MTRKNALFLALLLTYMVMLFGGAAIKPGYSHNMQYISELNATGSAHALLIGWLGFVPFGLAALALWNAARPHALAAGVHRTGYWLLLAEPIAYIGSANLTGAGLGAKSPLRRNFEAGILTNEPGLVQPLIEEVKQLWAGSHCQKCGRRDVCPDPIA